MLICIYKYDNSKFYFIIYYYNELFSKKSLTNFMKDKKLIYINNNNDIP